MTERRDIVIEGIEDIIERDLEKHKAILDRTIIEVQAFKQARSHEIKKKKHYVGLIGGGTYNDVSLQRSINDIAVNIRHMSDKVTTGEEIVKFEKHIVETLTGQLKEQREGLVYLAQYRREHGTSH